MKARKLIALILCAVMSLSLVACNKDTRSPGSTETGKEYVVTYDANGGSVSPTTQKVRENGTVNPPKPDNRDGYVFVGWFTSSGSQFTSSTKVTGNITVTARWMTEDEYNAAATAYEEGLTSANGWKSGHLYIHYKRYDHKSSDEFDWTNNGPEYTTPIDTNNTYSNWGLWAWPKNYAIGRSFRPAKIDQSGAVYDIELDHTYNDAGWDPVNKVQKTNEINYKINNDNPVNCVGIQLFSISSRTEGTGFWANDGGDVDVFLDEIVRSDGTYHWFVSQGSVTKGSKTYSIKTLVDPYKNLATGAAKTRKDGDQMINSNSESTFQKVTSRARGWDDDAVGYQIFIASFADSDGDGMGDIPGIISKLDYLDSLNIDVLWLTPFQSSTNYHGYDIKDYYSVDSRFGTLADYRELVYKAHQKGIKIVMDFVLNHTSKANPWFVNSQNLLVVDKETGEELSEDPLDKTAIDYRQFYNWIDKATYNKLPAAQKTQWYGPLNGNGKEEDGYYFYSSFSSEMPELNYDYQPVRDAVLDVCYYWMAFGLDGFRLDAVKHIYMKNEVIGVGKAASNDIIEDDAYSVDRKRNINFYREFNARLKKVYPNAFVVGENLTGNPAETAPYYQGIDSQFNFNFYYDIARKVAQSGGGRINKYPGGQGTTTPGYIGGMITTDGNDQTGSPYGKSHTKYYAVNPGYIDGQFTSNHDLPRARERMNIKETVAGDGKIDDHYGSFYSDNSIDGKKNNGTLNEAKVKETEVLLHLYYATLLTLPGICWIYYGDELGMAGIMQYTLTTGSTSSTTSEPHEDMIYRQPMKWKNENNSKYEIGFDKKVEELVGLNVAKFANGQDCVPSVEAQTVSITNGKYVFKDGGMLKWVQTLTAYRRTNKLGNKTITDSNPGGEGVVGYKIGNKQIIIYAGQSSARQGAAYDGVINGLHYGVVLG